jgi:hypothetical protein
MGTESTGQPFEAETDWYVENVILPKARELGNDAALTSWMEQEATVWRKIGASCCLDRRETETPEGRRLIERDLVLAELLEKLAADLREARPPKLAA